MTISGSGMLSNVSCLCPRRQLDAHMQHPAALEYILHSVKSRACVFSSQLIGNCWTLYQLFMSSPLSQTFVMFSSEIQVMDSEVFNLLFGKELPRVAVIFELYAF